MEMLLFRAHRGHRVHRCGQQRVRQKGTEDDRNHIDIGALQGDRSTSSLLEPRGDQEQGGTD